MNRPINTGYQYKSKSVTKDYALFTHIDHKYELGFNKEYNQKLYHFSGFTKNDVNVVKLIFRLYIPKVIVKVFITYIKKNIKKLIKSKIVEHYGNGRQRQTKSYFESS